jgi:hypothetical protein
MKVMNVIIEIDWKAMCAERDLIIERLEIENARLKRLLEDAEGTMLFILEDRHLYPLATRVVLKKIDTTLKKIGEMK